MKKIASIIIVCFLVVLIQFTIEILPIARYPLQVKICKISVEEILQNEKLIHLTNKISRVEKDQLISFKKEICNQH